MLHLALGVSTAVTLVYWVGLIALAVWAYRHLRLPSIPWLVAGVLISAVVGPFASHLMKDIAEGGMQQSALLAASGLSLAGFQAAWSYVGIAIATLSDAIVAWLLVSEFAVVLSKSSLADGVSIPRAALMPRQHVAAFGIALLISCVAGQLILLLLWAA